MTVNQKAGTSRRNLITAGDLLDVIARGGKVVLLDVRYALGRPPLRGEYEAAHLPGAIFVDLTQDLAGPRFRFSGDLPLPEVEQIQQSIKRWGIDGDSLVVVYTNDTPPSAARAWFVLRWAGVENVRYLDGGLRAWVGAGGELGSALPAAPAPGTFQVRPGGLAVIDADAAAGLAADGVLIDARARANYVGEAVPPGEPPKGHIPGALSGPGADNLTPEGFFKSPEALKWYYASLGVNEDSQVGAYCGGGVSATLTALALAEIGISAPVYVGSWSAWSSDPSRPVEIGEGRG